MTATTDDAPTDPRGQFQHELDWTMDDQTLTLDAPKERPGPVVLRNNATLDGRGCTVWAREGPVVRVIAERAVLKDLRIEYTGPDGGVALSADHAGITLDNVTVRGAVVGLAVEAGEWRYPHQLNLGTVLPGVPHAVRLRVVVPVPCQLSSEVAGVTLTPRTLAPGAHEVRLLIEPLSKDTLVCGTLTIKTAFLRREIVLNAHALAPAAGLPPPASQQERVVWEPPDWATAATAARSAPVVAPPVPPPAVPRKTPVADASGSPVVPPPPLPPWVVSPPVVPSKPRVRTTTGPLLGGAFSSPRIDPPPAVPPPVAEVPPPVVEPPPKPKFKPASSIPLWAQPPKPPAPPPPT